MNWIQDHPFWLGLWMGLWFGFAGGYVSASWLTTRRHIRLLQEHVKFQSFATSSDPQLKETTR